MDYSKGAVLGNRYKEVNTIKNTVKWTSRLKNKLKESKIFTFILSISVLCFVLILVDIMLIFNFVNIMQNML